MIDIKDFSEKEAKGLVTLLRITENVMAIYSKKFDPATGEELPEEVAGGDIQEYKDKKASLQAEIDEINTFISKFEALTSQN